MSSEYIHVGYRLRDDEASRFYKKDIYVYYSLNEIRDTSILESIDGIEKVYVKEKS